MATGKRLATLRTKVSVLDTRCASTLPAVERIRGYKLTQIRQRILLRDEYTCQRCGHVSINLEIDHIYPLHLGGKETDENRQALCKDCHALKSEREAKDRGGIESL